MAEQFMTRRERREAEQRAAEAAAAAQAKLQGQSPAAPAPADEAEPQADQAEPQADQAEPQADEAKQAAPAQAAATEPQAAESEDAAPSPKAAPSADLPTVDDAPIEPVRHERGPLASDHPQREADPREAAESVSLRPGKDDIPDFATRAERKRYLRERGLLPLPVDADESQQDSAPAEEEAEPEKTPQPTLPAVDPQKLKEPQTAEKPQRKADKPKQAADKPKTADKPKQAGEKAAADKQQKADAHEKSADPSARTSDLTARRQSANAARSTRSTTRGSGAALADPAGLDPGTESSTGADPSAQRGVPGRSRRAPVVQPPNTNGIRVVTGATSLARTQAAMEAARKADEGQQAQTQSSKTRPDGTHPAGEYGGDDDQRLRVSAAHPPTQPIDSVSLDAESKEDAALTEEVWELPGSGEGDETATPPAPPLSAREVTQQDGEILVGDRPSKLPYILLGVSGALALALVIIGLVMLF